MAYIGTVPTFRVQIVDVTPFSGCLEYANSPRSHTLFGLAHDHDYPASRTFLMDGLGKDFRDALHRELEVWFTQTHISFRYLVHIRPTCVHVFVHLPEQDPVFLCLNLPDPIIDILFEAIADTRRLYVTPEYRQWDAPPLPLSKTHH